MRPAPVQVNYLGFPGTLGAGYIDYIIADQVVIPPDEAEFYAEKVAWLPDCYQANDTTRRIADRTPTRLEQGLPEQGFVFCSFNNTYKITPDVFDVWMRLLGRVEGSVLWLLEGVSSSSANLKHEAEKRGVSADRIVFASRASQQDHLTRQQA